MLQFLLFNTFFFTLLLFCAYIALGQWRQSKDDAVPWYLGYLAATFLHYGRQFWIDMSELPDVPDMPDPPLEWGTPLSYAAFACYFLFVGRMLRLLATAPPLNRALEYLARFLGLMSIGHLLVQARFGYAVADAAHQVFQVLLLPVLIWLVVKALWHAGLFYQKLVLAGTAALVLGFLCVLARRRLPGGYVPLPDMLCCFPTRWGDFCLYHLKVGVVLDVLFFSWALTLRQKILLEGAIQARKQEANSLGIPVQPVSYTTDALTGIPATTEPQKPMPVNSLLEHVNACLKEHYADEQFTVKAIARSVNYSVSHLNRKLKEATGYTTEQYLLRYRLERAHELLANTDKTASTIASEVGLKDPSHFSKAFKKRYGCSPGAVRRDNAFY